MAETRENLSLHLQEGWIYKNSPIPIIEKIDLNNPVLRAKLVLQPKAGGDNIHWVEIRHSEGV